MHLLSAERATADDLDEAIDLEQEPGDIVIISAAETELACFASAASTMADGFPTIRLANLMQLGHPMSVDIYVERTIEHAKIVVLRLLGGKSYWDYGLEQIEAAARRHNIPFFALPGDDKPDDELARASLGDVDARLTAWRYLIEGGVANARECLRFLAATIGREQSWIEPRPLMKAAIYWPGMSEPSLRDLCETWSRPRAMIVFYRALYQAGQLEVIDALIDALDAAGLDALPVYVASLKDPASAALIEKLIDEAQIGIVLNTTGFAVGARPTVLDQSGAVVIQSVISGGAFESWRAKLSGLSPRDLAMHVVLPEIDGRIMSRVIGFKGPPILDERTQVRIARYEPVFDRLAFVAELAANWARLRSKPKEERKIAIVLANYPTKDGRLANGVGLDTPASVINIMRALEDQGYRIEDIPGGGNRLIEALQAGVTNATAQGRLVRASLKSDDYRSFFDGLPDQARAALDEQWGTPPTADFAIAVIEFGNIAVAIQPARGYEVDPKATYHSPDLLPTHDYLAFYCWLRRRFAADAVIHAGKHGNLEWLPGKAVALANTCWPEIALGPLPHLYPFIVNDPGEGSQAKRRAQAVIIDHLTPPMSRAEIHGELVTLERLVDEYFEAASLDPRRTSLLQDQILAESGRLGLAADLAFAQLDDEDAQLQELDNHLCELKEMQIRDGLHILGESPKDRQRRDLLIALLRLPRGKGVDGDASILRALADDFDLGAANIFDPLDCVLADPWMGARPGLLQALNPEPWRSNGDTVERLELFAIGLIDQAIALPKGFVRTQMVMADAGRLAGLLDMSGSHEIAGLLKGLDGRFVEPGPSGAPTRGRVDVLPTGRNFYSIDSRSLPTPTAWNLGWKSAGRVIDFYLQTHGDWPKKIALSAWGTANMRTGGDDLAQALALMGTKPVWDDVSGRVTGIEILPLSVLGRPRVDVTLRISGFFRDAFPAQIELIDDAVRSVASLDEPDAMNPLKATAGAETKSFADQGIDPAHARRLATTRIYGAKPGAYGAGLQALIDGGGWQDQSELADAYLAWGGFAYGRNLDGDAARNGLETRLSEIELVLHNQDNREHDILDSDDYYQFEGGLAAAVKQASGRMPEMFHNDHSRPESPKIRTLSQEIARVVRGRAANPKWIEGVMRHGYKGAFEMSASLDYLFAFAATTGLVQDHHFDQLYDAYLGDDRVRAFIETNNPEALKEIAARFDEAIRRGFWRPGRNSVANTIEPLLESVRP